STETRALTVHLRIMDSPNRTASIAACSTRAMPVSPPATAACCPTRSGATSSKVQNSQCRDHAAHHLVDLYREGLVRRKVVAAGSIPSHLREDGPRVVAEAQAAAETR